MKTVDVHLLGRSYQIACEPGQEKHLQRLAQMVEDRMKRAATSGQGAIGEIRLFLLAALMLADDVVEAEAGNARALADLSRRAAEDEDLMVTAVDHLAGRISALAARVENA